MVYFERAPDIELDPEVKAKMVADKVWDSWTDVLGQEIRVGDHVAIAVINGRSPQMVIGEVLKINAVNSRGEPHTHWTYDRHVHQRTEHVSCSMRVMPIKDARGFYRSGTRQGVENKAVTYQIPENIIKVPNVDR